MGVKLARNTRNLSFPVKKILLVGKLGSVLDDVFCAYIFIGVCVMCSGAMWGFFIMLSDSGLRALYFIILSFKHCLHCTMKLQYNMKSLLMRS